MKKLIFTFLGVVAFALNISAQTSWIPQYSPYLDTVNLGKIQFVSATEGWISASNGKLLHTTNSGDNWVPVTLVPVLQLFALSDPDLSICFINPSTGWSIRTVGSTSVPSGAVLYKTVNGGINWTSLTIPNYSWGFSVQFVDANTGWICMTNSNATEFGFCRSTDGGNNWSTLSVPPVLGFPFFANSNTGWLMPLRFGGVGTTADTIRKTTNGGLTWTAPWGTNAQVSYTSMHFSDVNNGWVVGAGGIVLKTTNSGASWNYITNTGQTSTYKSLRGFFLNANTGWIGTKETVSGTVSVIYTNNGGATWTWQMPPVSSNSNSNITGIHFYDALNGGISAREGQICHTTNGGIGITQISTEVPESYSLSQNYPNPFNPSTYIKFDVSKGSFVSLVVFDALGREVAVLVNEQLKPGTYEADWNASNYPSGVYFYRLSTEVFNKTMKMILVK